MKIILIPPKQKVDYLAEVVIEGLYKNGVEIFSSDFGNGIREEDVYDDDEIIKYSTDVDYIFVIWGKITRNYTGPKYYLLDRINKLDKVVFIDGSEWTYTAHPTKNQVKNAKINPTLRRGTPWINEFMFNKSRWYFKRECYSEDLDRGIIPLLFGAVDKYFLNIDVEKKYDIFCSFGQLNDGLRLETFNVCKKLMDEGYSVFLENNLSFETYKEKLASSYIGVDAWGGGDCCARLWQILAAKTLAITQKYNIEFPNEFVDESNIIQYENVNEFELKIKKYLLDKEKIKKMSDKSYAHLLKYHTSDKRVNYIFERLV